METARMHYWTQDLFIGAAKLDFLPYVTSVQRYKCHNCDETLSLPDCVDSKGKSIKTCLTLLSFGCKNDFVRPPLPPRKEKAPYTEKKDYPAPKQKRGSK